MAPRLILPRTFIEDERIDSPLFFLIGTIRGAPYWQDKATEIIYDLQPNSIIVSPSNKIRLNYKETALKGPTDTFSSGTLFERHYLSYCWDPVQSGQKRKGTLVIWLPAQTDFTTQHVYGRDTRAELGEARGSLKFDPSVRIAIGADPRFPGIDVIQTNFRAVKPDLVFQPTLEQTCNYSVSLSGR